MLPLPNLDDRFFDDIVDEARMLIPTIIPTWTDENEYDPGITLIELFSWLIEMQQYYMNRIIEQSEINFLKLLGIQIQQISSAKVDVFFSGVTKDIILPKRSKFMAHDLVFETDKDHTLIPNNIEKVIVRADAESNDYTSLNDYKSDSFYAFGSSVLKGNTLFIGLQKEVLPGQELTLSIYMFDDYPVTLGSDDHQSINIVPSGNVSWEFFGIDKDNGGKRGWFPVEISEDQTFHMSKSGQITLKMPFQMSVETVYPANDIGRYWISCTVNNPAYELPPRIKQVAINTISVVHEETLSETRVFASSGEKNETLELTDYLSFYEKLIIQVKDDNGYWRIWNRVSERDDLDFESHSYIVEKDQLTKKTKITFGDGVTGKKLPKNKEAVRAICYLATFERMRYLGISNGLPNQTFELYDLEIIPQSFIIQVGKKVVGCAELVWEDWHQVDNFMNSNATDLHFVYDDQNHRVLFGNNEKGSIPADVGMNNICMIQCRVGGGSKGNIKQHLIKEIVTEDDEIQRLHITNHHFARGGREKETLVEAKQRYQKELTKQDRAVTSEDFELIVKQTPGIRVGRVKAIPLYAAGLKDYPIHKVPAQVTVVVVPYSESKKPIPSQGFLQTVKQYIDQYRLITTEVHVIAPEYIKITIYAVVVVEPYLKGDSTKVVKALNQLLHPLDYETKSDGWEFGRSVYKGDIYGAINEIEGVTFIKELWIEGEGAGIQKEASGNIIIPPHGLVYSGQHQIEVISKTDL